MKNNDDKPNDGSGEAVALHRLVQHFERDKTGNWRKRQRVRTHLELIREAANEALLCLDVEVPEQRNLKQASDALGDMEYACRFLLNGNM